MVENPSFSLSRRNFLGGLSAAALASALPRLALAQDAAPMEIAAVKRSIEVNGRAAQVYGIDFPGGRRLYEAARGDRFRVRLMNKLDTPTLIHWHGLTPPSNQDGVPELSQPALASGSAYDYDFPLTRSGTFWMHSHVGLQEQSLLAAPLILTDPADAGRDEQPVVIFLEDFTFRPPEEILAELRKSGGMAGSMSAGNMPMTQGQMSGMSMGQGQMQGMAMPMDHGKMQMQHQDHMTMDLNDVTYDAFLANDRTLADPEVISVAPGAKLRLRIINGAASSNFHIDLGHLAGELIAVDGDPVIPVKGSRFPLAMAQRINLRVTLPKGSGSYPILALREGAAERTGIVLATKGAPVSKLAQHGAKATGAIDFALEARLRAATALAPKPARVVSVILGGDMEAYDWSIHPGADGQSAPIEVKHGERVELVLVNKTMMSHPIHLHGHHFQVVARGEKRFPGALRDTVLVLPMESVTIAFDADNPGRWAFHCHNLYHMQAGMMTEVRYTA